MRWNVFLLGQIGVTIYIFFFVIIINVLIITNGVINMSNNMPTLTDLARHLSKTAAGRMDEMVGLEKQLDSLSAQALGETKNLGSEIKRIRTVSEVLKKDLGSSSGIALGYTAATGDWIKKI